MDERHLGHEEFFEKLNELFAARKGGNHGAIYLTQKRLSYKQDVSSTPEGEGFGDLHPSHPLPLIVRASNGKSKRDKPNKVKLSTIVTPDDLDGFYVRYAEVCKAGMTALKPRDRSKKKAKAKKKKATA